jgi:protein-L-isoaspartate(D-aspartate) O-methyltransferase
MSDLSIARVNMVEGQIRANKVTDRRIVEAMAAVPREKFVSKLLAGVAYIDEDIPIAPDRYLLEPMVFARLLQAAAIGPDDVVLDIGCGTGYSAAILAHLAAAVVALENDQGLADGAIEKLAELGADNVAVVSGKLSKGFPDQGPYDVVVINGSVERIPENIVSQVSNGGRIVAVINESGIGRATLMRVQDGQIAGIPLFETSVPSLPGFGQARGFVF